MPSDAWSILRPEGYEGFPNLEDVMWNDDLEWNDDGGEISYRVEGFVIVTTQERTARATRWQPAEYRTNPHKLGVIIVFYPEAEGYLGSAEIYVQEE